MTAPLGVLPITQEQLDFTEAMRKILALANIPVQKANTICNACFDATCEKATDNPQCYCCVSNHVI